MQYKFNVFVVFLNFISSSCSRIADDYLFNGRSLVSPSSEKSTRQTRGGVFTRDDELKVTLPFDFSKRKSNSQ